MGIGGRLPSHQRLQQAVQLGRRLQIFASGYQRHTLQRVVVRHAQMIACRRVFPGQHDVAELLWGDRRCGPRLPPRRTDPAASAAAISRRSANCSPAGDPGPPVRLARAAGRVPG